MQKLNNDQRKILCKDKFKASEPTKRKHEKRNYHLEDIIESNSKSSSHSRKLLRLRSRSADRKKKSVNINQKKFTLEFKEK